MESLDEATVLPALQKVGNSVIIPHDREEKIVVEQRVNTSEIRGRSHGPKIPKKISGNVFEASHGIRDDKSLGLIKDSLKIEVRRDGSPARSYQDEFSNLGSRNLLAGN